MKETKVQQIQAALKAGDNNRALKICKGFFYGWTDDEKRSIEIAHESRDAHRAKFYKGMGVDTDEEYKKALILIQNKFKEK